MIFLLPDKIGKSAFEEFENVIFNTTEDNIIQKIRDSQEKQELTILGIPKFKIESTYDNFVKIFTELGYITPFIPGEADFSKITQEFSLYFNKIIQKAVIILDESGTEAAAATAIMFMYSSSERRIYEFILNRPFMCLLVDTKTKNIFFVAKKVKF
jgi:serpin B